MKRSPGKNTRRAHSAGARASEARRPTQRYWQVSRGRATTHRTARSPAMKPGEKYAKGVQRRRESKRGKAPDAAILASIARKGNDASHRSQPGDEAKPGEKYAKGAQRRRESKRGKAPDAAILASIARKGNDASRRSQPGDEARKSFL